jgi:putative tricarboxylic transport membrane protein
LVFSKNVTGVSDMWLEAFKQALSGSVLPWLFVGSMFGIVCGFLPALGSAFALAIALPFTFGMNTATALVFLCAIQAACIYGDSFTSILVNIPGGPSTVASCWDGYPMAQRGRAGMALGISATSSFVGAAISWLSFAFLAGPVTRFAMQIGPPEYFALGVMALGLVALASRGETLKGLIMACLGVVISFIGADPITALTKRFTFGVRALGDGFEIVVASLGIFAVAQLFEMLSEGGSIAKAVDVKDNVLSGAREVLRRPLTILRSSVVGWFVGILPALGLSLAGISTYLVEKRYSDRAANFGKGEPTALMAAEIGKGSCVIGDMIPTLTLGVPGSVTGALYIAALMLHGVDPGPRFMTAGVVPFVVLAGLLLGHLVAMFLSLFTARWASLVVRIPNVLLAPFLAVLCFLGAYTVKNSTFDILAMIGLGIVAAWAKRGGYPGVCLVLGIILGPLVETNFHRSLAIGLGSYSVFWTRPITATLLGISLLFMLSPYILALLRNLFKGGRDRADQKEAVPEEKPTLGLNELTFLLFTLAIFGTFLVLARSYGSAVRLFPIPVCAFGLFLVIWRLVGMFSPRIPKDLRFSIPLRSNSGGLTTPVVVAALFGFLVLEYLIGFVLASTVFFVGVCLLAGYRRWPVLLAMAGGTAVLLPVFAHLTKVILPVGVIFGGL